MGCSAQPSLSSAEIGGGINHDLFCWSDPAAWAPLTRNPKTLLTPEGVLATLLESYAGLRVFHACRTLDLRTYLRDGIHPWRAADLNEAARRLAHDFDPAVLDRDIDLALEGVPVPVEGNVYASVDRRQLHNDIHFLKYGSERVYLILKRLGESNGQDYLSKLGALGRPFVFDLAIPWLDVSLWLREQLANAIAHSADEVRLGREVVEREWVHSQDKPVLPAAIVAYREVPQ